MPAVPTRLALVTAIAAALAALAGAVPAPAAATVRAVACPFPTVGLPGSTTCHRVAVPLDRSAPGSRELEPFVLRTGARHAARPPLVLLAGGPTMLSWPDALCAALAPGGRHVVRYDLRDCGASTTVRSKAPAYTLRDLARRRAITAWSRTWSGARRRETSGCPPGARSPRCPGP